MQKLKVFAGRGNKSISPGEMRALELNAYGLGITPARLMENAGKAVADFVESRFNNKKRVLIVCGTGNNGGDGFVAAMRLQKKQDVSVLLVGEEGSIKQGPARLGFSALKKSGIRISYASEGRAKDILHGADVVIDAIFGTGFHGSMPELAAEVAKQMNAARKPIVAVDVPSGLGDDGKASKDAVRPTYTVAFHKKKLWCNAHNSGKIVAEDIGIPLEAELFTGTGDAYMAYRKRSAFSSKNANGRVLVIGGSGTYHGAPLMAVNAANNVISALRVGAGYAIACLPKRVADAARVLTVNIIVKDLTGEKLVNADLAMLKNEVARANAVVVGPGLGRDDETLRATAKLIEFSARSMKKVVADADACYAVQFMHGRLNRNILFTPHDREFAQMFGSVPRQESEAALIGRAKLALRWAGKLNATILLKGHNTIITNGDRIKINRSRSAALATMGTGDALAGIIGGYAAAGAGTFEAAAAGAYLHSRIADEFAEQFGEHMIAEDIIGRIPKTLKEIEDSFRA